MKEQETGKVNLTIALFVIVLIIMLVIAYFIYNIYTDKKALDEKIQELGNTVSSLQNTVNTLETPNNANTNNTITNGTNTTDSTISTNHTQNKTILKDISYIEIEMLVENAQNEGPTYHTKKITDQAIIANIKNMINNATNYTSDEAYGLPEDSPKLYVYQTDGNKISIIVEDLETINNIGVWTKEDASDKIFYRVDAKLAPYLEKVYKESK